MIRIAVAEDNFYLAKAIEEKLSFFGNLKLKFIAKNGLELIGQLTTDSNIDVILMDIQMPEMDGIDATAIVRQKFPHIKVIILTVFDDDDHIYRAIRNGANGYLLKETNAKNIHDGIIEVLEGGASMSPTIALKALNLLRNAPSMEVDTHSDNFNLTQRETEVLEQIVQGLSYQEIANNLNISSGTVRKHIENVYRKLEVNNKVEALQVAQKYRLV